jgi:hypothetical protein
MWLWRIKDDCAPGDLRSPRTVANATFAFTPASIRRRFAM